MFLAIDPFLFSREWSLIAFTVGLARDHPVDLLSFKVFAAPCSQDGGGSRATKAREQKKKRKVRESERCWESGGGKGESDFCKASTDSIAELRAKVSLTGLCGLSVVLLEVRERLHSRDNRLVNILRLLGARSRVLSHDDVARSSIRDCAGSSHFLDERKFLFVPLGSVAVKVLHFSSKKACGTG